MLMYKFNQYKNPCELLIFSIRSSMDRELPQALDHKYPLVPGVANFIVISTLKAPEYPWKCCNFTRIMFIYR